MKEMITLLNTKRKENPLEFYGTIAVMCVLLFALSISITIFN